MASEQIKVAVRVRHLLSRENNLSEYWKTESNDSVVYSGSSAAPLDGGSGGGSAAKRFVFDRVFGKGEDNLVVYTDIGMDIINSAMNGFNSTVFAYGQTASGKTHTMMGSDSEPGFIPQAVQQIFDYIENAGERQFLMRVSYMEIYNECVHDLLAAVSGHELRLFFHPVINRVVEQRSLIFFRFARHFRTGTRIYQFLTTATVLSTWTG